LFEEKIYDAINLEKCVNDRLVAGGPSAASVDAQLEYARGFCE